MSGYHWYDRLTRISGLRFTFDQDGAVYIFASETVDAPESGLVENLNLLVEVSNATAETITVRSEEHTSELQSLMRISYAVFCLKKKIKDSTIQRRSI